MKSQSTESQSNQTTKSFRKFTGEVKPVELTLDEIGLLQRVLYSKIDGGHGESDVLQAIVDKLMDATHTTI